MLVPHSLVISIIFVSDHTVIFPVELVDSLGNRTKVVPVTGGLKCFLSGCSQLQGLILGSHKTPKGPGQARFLYKIIGLSIWSILTPEIPIGWKLESDNIGSLKNEARLAVGT